MAKQQWKSASSPSSARPPRGARWADSSRDRARRSANLALPISLFVIAIFALWWVLTILNPVPPPSLFVITSESSSDLLPPNDLAVNDASQILKLTNVFDVSEAQLKDVSQLRDHEPRTHLLRFWKPTTIVVYVNAIGIGLPESDGDRAWLLPEAFDPERGDFRSQSVPVSEVLRAVGDSTADQKLVVFDCQRLAIHPHLGFATTQFVEAAQADIRENIPESELAGVSVLFSCSVDEATWPMYPHENSVFGHFFVNGITGAADSDAESGNGDNRVSVKELADYLTRHVGDWAAQNCSAAQRPVLYQDLDDETDFELVEAVGQAGDSVARSTVSRDPLESQLRDRYARCAELAPSMAAIREWTPVTWTEAQDSLLMAERLYRAGNIDEAQAKLEAFDRHVGDLMETHNLIQERIASSSPSGRRFLSRCSAFGGPASQAGEIDAPSPADELIDQFAEGSLTITDADEALREIARGSGDPLPSAAQLLRLLVARNGTAPEEELRQLVARRMTADAATQPRYCLAEPWVFRRDLEAADAARRSLEDEAFLTGWVPVSVGSENQADGPPQYDVISERRDLLTRSFQLRDRLLAELPYWISFLYRSEQHIQRDDSGQPVGEEAIEVLAFPRTADEVVPSLIAELQTLHNELVKDPGSMTTEQFDIHLGTLESSADKVETNLNHLDEDLARYASLLIDDRYPLADGDRWRRIDAVLELPFATTQSAKDGGVAEVGNVRIALLRRSVADREETETRPAAELPELSRNLDGHHTDILELYRQLYSSALGITESTDSGLDDILNDAVHRDLIDVAQIGLGDPDREAGLRADAAFRLLRRGFGTDYAVTSPAVRVRAEALSRWLLWQAGRVNDDFYAGVDSGRDPFFVQLAGDLLTASRELADAEQFLNRAAVGDATAGSQPSDLLALVQRRIDDRANLLTSAQLELIPNEVEFRLTASERLTVAFLQSDQFPTGRAAIRVASETVQSTPGPHDGPAHFILNPTPSGLDENQEVAVAGYFRGHEFSASVPVSIIRDVEGPAVTYREQNTGGGRLRIRAQRADEERLNLLFVLDYSGSMARPDPTGAPRINSLHAVLSRFVDAMDTENLRVGVRVFGHSVADINAPEARTDTELIIPIGRFGPGTLDFVTNHLPLGHSPIFNALLEARWDFDQLDEGRNEIVLISDGADNWVSAGERPGLDELSEAFRGSQIRINAIGYDMDDSHSNFRQLAQIAECGDLLGQCVEAEDAHDLLRELAGLIGMPSFRVLENGRPIDEPRQFAGASQYVSLEEGQYAVQVVGPSEEVLDEMPIRVLPGEDHVLVFDSGRLGYEYSPRESALKVEYGDDTQPDLVILKTQPGDEELTVQFGLLPKPGSPDNPAPVSVQITAIADTRIERQWFLKYLRPNVSNLHFPTWELTIEDWPATATDLELRVTWQDLKADDVDVPLDWDLQLVQRDITDELSLVHRERISMEIDGVQQSGVVLTFVLNQRGAGIEDYAVDVPDFVSVARQSYDREFGTYRVQLVTVDGSELDRVSVVRMGEAPANRQLTVVMPLVGRRINP